MVTSLEAQNAYATALRRMGGEAQRLSDAESDGANVNQPSFASFVKDAVQSAADNVRAGETATVAGVTGNADLSDVVTAVSNAEVTLQTVMTIRDKVMGAYQEIMRMPV